MILLVIRHNSFTIDYEYIATIGEAPYNDYGDVTKERLDFPRSRKTSERNGRYKHKWRVTRNTHKYPKTMMG